MPHDPVRVADTKGWLAKATEDLAAAERLIAEPSLYGAVAARLPNDVRL